MAYCVTNNDETVPVENLMAEVSIFLPKVSSAISRAALMRSIMGVVDKSKVLSYTVTQDAFKDVTGYTVEIPNCNTVLLVEKATLNGTPVPFEMTDRDWIELGVTPGSDSENGIELKVYAGISAENCEIPKHIYERYGQVIINGALSILYGMNDEEWFSPELVKFYGGIAKGGVDAIKQDTLEQQAPDGIKLEAGGGLIV